MNDKLIFFKITLRSTSTACRCDEQPWLVLTWLLKVQIVVCVFPSRTRPCVHSLPPSCHSSTMASALVCVLFCHDHPSRNRWTSKLLFLRLHNFSVALAIIFFKSLPLNSSLDLKASWPRCPTSSHLKSAKVIAESFSCCWSVPFAM